MQHVARLEDHDPLDDVAEFADVPRPGVGAEGVERAAREPLHVLAEFLVEVLREVRREERDVLGAGAERRDEDRHDVDPVVEVLAERALPHRLGEVAVRRRDHPHVHADVARAADPLERLLLEETEQLRLQRRAHVPDLVEEDRAAVGQFEQSLLPRPRVGEGAPLVAEQLALQQRLRNGGAGDVHEGAVGPLRGVVDRLGDDVLADARLALQQHRRGRRGGDLLDHVEDGAHRRRAADQRRGAVDPLLVVLEAAQFAQVGGRLQRALDDGDELAHVHGLGEVVVGAELDRLDRLLDRPVGGEHDDRRLRRLARDLRDRLEAGAVRQPVVEDDEVVEVGGEALARGGQGVGFVGLEALAGQPVAQRPAHESFVVHEQNFLGRHAVMVGPPRPPRNRPASAARLRRAAARTVRAARAPGRKPYGPLAPRRKP